MCLAVAVCRYDGGLTATALDLSFWSEMFPYENRYERPTLHVSVRSSRIFYKWQPPPDAAVGPPPAGHRRLAAAGASPSEGSHDAAMLRMLSAVSRVVSLPDTEIVAHTDPLPKAPPARPASCKPSRSISRTAQCGSGSHPAAVERSGPTYTSAPAYLITM